jgi:hypothetical protein
MKWGIEELENWRIEELVNWGTDDGLIVDDRGTGELMIG